MGAVFVGREHDKLGLWVPYSHQCPRHLKRRWCLHKAARAVQILFQVVNNEEHSEQFPRAALPVGYRLVAIASDAWVLVAPGGERLARYQGERAPWRAELDAREHHSQQE